MADEDDFRDEEIERLGIKKKYENDSLERCTKEIIEDIREITK